MPSVTADSNIWVSAFGYGGKPRRLFEMADAGEIRVDISEFIIDEVLRTLHDKFEDPSTMQIFEVAAGQVFDGLTVSLR